MVILNFFAREIVGIHEGEVIRMMHNHYSNYKKRVNTSERSLFISAVYLF